MSSSEEMMQLIMDIAKQDDRIRGVYMNGSRANPNAPKDPYQDFDIVYAVTDMHSFIADKSWPLKFGDIAIVQKPELMDLHLGKPEVNFEENYAWLMLFQDGNRIDLTIRPVNIAKTDILSDCMTVLLLDKDGMFPTVPETSDRDYQTTKPTQYAFEDCANEFWWCLNNVGKGMCRNEIPYVQEVFHHYVRNALNNMVNWYIGMHHGFQVNPGKLGKWYKDYLPADIYAMYLQTYSDCEHEHIWHAVFTACDLFGMLARELAKNLSLTYHESEEKNTIAYLKRMQQEDKL